MSEDKIAEIRDRHSKRTGIDHNGSYRLDGYSYPGTLTQSQRDLETALAEVERLREALQESACACSSIRECASEWAKDGKCPHLIARVALEGKP